MPARMAGVAMAGARPRRRAGRPQERQRQRAGPCRARGRLLGEDFVREEDPGFVTVDDDGHWGIGFVANSFIPEAEAVDTWEVTATCLDAETDEVLVDYEVPTFEVKAPPTPPTAEPPTPPTTIPEPPQAPSAAPVVTPPAFTG
jgi:hypothetical protein